MSEFDPRIRFYGKLFDGNFTTPAIEKAREEAKIFAALTVRGRTPVDTGLLKSQWQFKSEANGIRFLNDAPYAAYVEFGTRHMAGRHMLGNSLPAIKQVFEKALAREIGQRLATRLVADPATPSYANFQNKEQGQLKSRPDGMLERLTNRFRGSS